MSDLSLTGIAGRTVLLLWGRTNWMVVTQNREPNSGGG
jgi:hypothetical protein